MKKKLSICSWAYIFNQEKPTNDFHEILHELQHLDYAAVIALTRLSVDGLRRRMRRGQFPRPCDRRGTKRYWLRSEVEAAVARLVLPVPLTVSPAESA